MSNRPADKLYKKSDGGGPYILVQPDGKRFWRMAYRLAAKIRRDEGKFSDFFTTDDEISG